MVPSKVQHPMDTPPANPESEIPELPGHYRRTAWYFMRWWLVFVASMGVLAMGMEWQIITMQIAGGAGCFVALMGLMTTNRSRRKRGVSFMLDNDVAGLGCEEQWL